MIHTLIRLFVVLNDSTFAKATGKVVKDVQCGNCASRYRYTLVRYAAATVSRFGGVTKQDKEKAVDLAQERLNAKLATDFDCTPCPTCWHYQPEMAEKLRKDEIKRHEKRVTGWAVGVLATLLPLLFCMPGTFYPGSKATEESRIIYFSLFGVLLTLVMCCMVFTIVSTVNKGRVKKTFDPNRDIPEETRKREAKRYAIPVRDATAKPVQPPSTGDEIEILD